jgi:putative NADH-flavin reductase
MTNVLVVGASRGIGLEVTSQALSRGHFVRAMSRGGKIPRRVEGKCEPFAGDARKAEDVRKALEQVDVVVQALGVEPSLKVILEPVTLFSEATRILLPEMERADVGRLICVTGFGAGDCGDSINFLQRLPFRLIFQNAYDDKSVQEEMISRSGLDWLIVRPGVLTNGPQSQSYRVLWRRDEWRNGIISRADVADFIVNRIEGGELGRKKPVLIRCPL